MKYQFLKNSRGQGLAEIIVILVVLLIIVLVSVRIIKKNVNDAGEAAKQASENSDAEDISPGMSPAKIIEGAKEKLEHSTTTLPNDLQEEEEEDGGESGEGEE